jgi:hypothetical protein
MTKFLAGVLSVIAVGVLLIAYGLLTNRAAAFAPATGFDALGRPILTGERVMLNPDAAYVADPYAGNPYIVRYPSGYSYPAYSSGVPVNSGLARPVLTSQVAEVAPQRVVTRRVVERQPTRNWKKTAMIIGGTSAAGAGVGAIFGGKKGALIGAAIGGGASTLYEATKDK